MKFDGLYEFTPAGMEAFQRAFQGTQDESTIDLTNPAIAKRISGTTSFEPVEWDTAYEMAEAIIASAGSNPIPVLLDRIGLWGWLAFVCRDAAYPMQKDGKRKLGEVHRWYPSDPNDYQKGQRHLIRMPVLLLSSFGHVADYLLLGSPSVPGEVREQMTSQGDMFNLAFQGAARKLYYDEEKGTLRRGAASKNTGGVARRLADVRGQLDVTWDLFALTSDQILDKLPPEFDRFKANLDEAKTLTGMTIETTGEIIV